MTVRPIPVAHVITRLDVGGAQETAVRLCRGLDRRRWTPLLIAGDDPGSGGTLLAEAEQNGIAVHLVASLHGPIRPGSDVQAVRDLTAVIRSSGAGLVHTHSSKAGVVGRIAARRAAVRGTLHTVHGWSFNSSQTAPVAAAYRAVERHMARRTDALITVSEADRATGIAHRIGRPEQYALIRSGIDIDIDTTGNRATTRRSFGWSDDDIVITSVGRLERQKDPIALVEAFAIARHRVPTLRLALVGEGSLAPRVRAAAGRLDVAERISLLGLRDDVADILGASDLFALSSRWEGLPRAVLEAVRAGLPVIATDTMGVRDIITDGRTGRLTPIGDPVAMAEAVVDCTHNRGRARSWAAEARTRLDQYSDSAMVAATEELYSRIVGQPSPLAAAR